MFLLNIGSLFHPRLDFGNSPLQMGIWMGLWLWFWIWVRLPLSSMHPLLLLPMQFPPSIESEFDEDETRPTAIAPHRIACLSTTISFILELFIALPIAHRSYVGQTYWQIVDKDPHLIHVDEAKQQQAISLWTLLVCRWNFLETMYMFLGKYD